MAIVDPEGLFVHELRDVLYAERTIERSLPKMAREASDPRLRQHLEHHLRETEEQIANVEHVLKLFGKAPRGQRCPGIDGIRHEHDEFMEANGKQAPSTVLDTFLCGAASRVEHYEIAAYTGLLSSAHALGNAEAAYLLQANLTQEQTMLERTTSARERLERQLARA
jgi:ferritin-like metal-binding protein YciE